MKQILAGATIWAWGQIAGMMMQDASFDTFKSAACNHEAVEICRAVAALRYTDKTPIVLLGPPGSGKSRLLWAIANTVRTQPEPAGIALILPDDFPEKVRHLAYDPAPIAGKPAVLLVDVLEGFEAPAAELEAVARRFLEHRHSVVFASEAHPSRLGNISEAFRTLLCQGRIASLQPAAAGLEPAADTEKLKTLEEELETLRWERYEALGEKEAVQAEADARIQSLEEALAAAQRERDAAQAASERMAADAAVILERLEAQQPALEQMQESLFAAARRCLAAASGKEDDFLAEELEDARAAAEAYRAQWEEERIRTVQELTQVRAERELAETELESLRGERGRLTVALEGARGRAGALETELDKARKHAAVQAAELDALRRAAAAQVAAAQIHAGELEPRIARAEAALDALRQICRATDSGLRRQASALWETAGILDALAERHAMVKHAGLETDAGESASDSQGYLFAPETLPVEESESSGGEPLPEDNAPAVPPQRPELRAIVQEALREPSPEESQRQ